MRHLTTCVVVAGALAFGAGLAVAEPPATKPPVSARTGATSVALPEAAKAAITKEFPKAAIGKVRAIGKEGAKTYSAEMAEGEKGEKKFNVQVTEGGIILMVTGPIAVADLPKPVADAVAKVADGATIKEAYKMERRADKDRKPLDKPVVIYEVTLVKGDLVGSMTLTEDGTVRRELKMGPTPPKPAKERATDIAPK